MTGVQTMAGPVSENRRSTQGKALRFEGRFVVVRPSSPARCSAGHSPRLVPSCQHMHGLCVMMDMRDHVSL